MTPECHLYGLVMARAYALRCEKVLRGGSIDSNVYVSRLRAKAFVSFGHGATSERGGYSGTDGCVVVHLFRTFPGQAGTRLRNARWVLPSVAASSRCSAKATRRGVRAPSERRRKTRRGLSRRTAETAPDRRLPAKDQASWLAGPDQSERFLALVMPLLLSTCRVQPWRV